MNRLFYVLISSALVGSLTVTAQPPGGGRGGPGGPPQGQRGQGFQQGRGPGGGGQGGGQHGGGQHGGPPPNAVMEALDADRDHVISAREMAGATAALKKLDKNRDGKLTSDEIEGQGGHQGGQIGNRGPGGPPGQGGPGGGRGGQGGPPTKEKFMEHAMTFDTDKDGKLSKSELSKMATELVAEMNNRGPGGPGGRGGQGGPGQGNGGGARQRPAIEE